MRVGEQTEYTPPSPLPANALHFGMVVLLRGEHLAVWIVLVGREVRVRDHDRLQMKTTIGQIHQRIDLHTDLGRGAAQNLTTRERSGPWHNWFVRKVLGELPFRYLASHTAM
jgi:hypothetical protein